VSEQRINFLLHPHLLLFSHVGSSVLSSESSFGSSLARSLLSKLICCSSRTKVIGKLEPGEVLGPSVDVERKFESHVRWQSDEVVLIVRGKHTTYDTVGAQSDTLDLITAFDDVVLGQKAGHFQ